MMHYDDPARPRSVSADNAALQVSGSPLPVITLIRPMESEGAEVWRCTGRGSRVATQPCNVPCGNGNGNGNGQPCERCERVRPAVWGWLASIHAHVEGSRFGYHTAFIADVGQFTEEYLADPEAALARWFKYQGPRAVGDLWEDG